MPLYEFFCDACRCRFEALTRIGGEAEVPCPKCGRTMMRRHYSYEHAVEVDYCSICDLYWFEKDEIEALQVLAERQSG